MMSRYDDPEDMGEYGEYPPRRSGRAGPSAQRRFPEEDDWGEFRRPRPGRGARNPARRGGRGSGWASVFGAHRVVAIVAIVTALVVVAGSMVAYAAYLGTVGRIHHITLSHIGKRPPVYNSAENILVIGAYNSSKDYVIRHPGASSDIGADTYVLVHIAPNHKGGVMLSFPRDSMVPVYSCPASTGFQGQQAQSGQLEPLNQTYSLGGPACALHTIEQQTGIRISHFIEVNYLGFEKFVGAVGGVQVCLPYTISHVQDAPGLHLKKGYDHINAKQALQFVRARYIGVNSDLQRIQRQQFFMISVMQSALHQGLLADPLKLYSVAHAVAPYLTTDTGFGLSAMYDLARSMQGTNLSKVQLIEVPTVTYQPNPNKVIWQPSVVDPLFRAIAHDRKVPKSVTRKGSSQKPSAPKVKPGQVHVAVLNGNGVAGGAATARTDLTSAGFTVTGTGDANNYSYSASVVEYAGKADLAAAKLLQSDVPGATLQQSPQATPGTVTLVIGSNFTGLKSPKTAAKKKHSGTSVSKLSKKFNGVTGSTNICKDQSAFAG